MDRLAPGFLVGGGKKGVGSIIGRTRGGWKKICIGVVPLISPKDFTVLEGSLFIFNFLFPI